MKRAVVAVWLGLSLATAGTAADAPVVTEIQVRNVGQGPVDEAFVTANTRVKTGDVFDRAAVARDVTDLLATRRFSSVRAEAEPLADGLRVVYVVSGKRRLASDVDLSGADHLRDSKVRDLLGVAKGALFDEQDLAVGARRVEEEYRKRLFPDARVSWTVDETRPEDGLAKVRVTVEEGGRARIRETHFEGNRQVSTKELKPVVQVKKLWNPLTWFKKPRYDPDLVEANRLALRELYLDRGFLDAEVDPPAVGRDENNNLVLTYAVREGVLYRMGTIALEGCTIFPEAEVMTACALREGDVASSKALRDTAQALRDYYGSRGYVETLVRPALDSDPSAGRMNVRFAITEGHLTQIRNIYVRGNTRTRDKVVRRELLVEPGETLNEVKLRTSEKRVLNLGFFSSVRSRLESTPLQDEKDVVLDVEEKRTGQLMVGAGFSSIDKVMGFVELSQGNFDIRGWPHFTGGGQKARARAQFGSRREEYELSVVEPWFLDRKLSLGLDLFRTSVDYDDYDETRTGGAVTLGKPLPFANRLEFRYQLENVALRDIADTNEYVEVDTGDSFFFRRESDTMKSSLRTSLTHDTRDNPFVPTHGMRASVFGTVMGGPFNFDTDLYELGTRARQYVPLWFKHVVSLGARYETVEAFGATEDVSIEDRLFLGGGRTLRGFEYRDVGPKAVPRDAPPGGSSYRPIGGRSLAMGSAEYAIPIVSHIRLATFYDIGNVWTDPYELDLNDLASSAGVGIRFDIPGFPIRIDRAWVIDFDDEYTDNDPWVFWIGFDY